MSGATLLIIFEQLGGSPATAFVSTGASTSHGTGVLLAARGLLAAGKSSSLGLASAIDRAVSFHAAGESESLSSGAALGRSTLIVGCGESISRLSAANLTVINATLKVSPRLATIVDTGSFYGSGKIARRT